MSGLRPPHGLLRSIGGELLILSRARKTNP
jgi:hypothetical protein